MTCTALWFSPLKLFLKHKLFLALLWINYGQHILEKLLGPLSAVVCVLCSFDSSGGWHHGTLAWTWARQKLTWKQSAAAGRPNFSQNPLYTAEQLLEDFIYLFKFPFHSSHVMPSEMNSWKIIVPLRQLHCHTLQHIPRDTSDIMTGVYLKGNNACCVLLFNYREH